MESLRPVIGRKPWSLMLVTYYERFCDGSD